MVVTDDAGRSHQVSVEVVADATIASDMFERTGSSWANADRGGAWALTGKDMTVADGAGLIALTEKSQTKTAWLKDTSARDVDVQMDFSFDKASAGGGTFISSGVRHSDSGEYRAKLVYNANGTMSAFLTRNAPGETVLKSVVLPDLQIQPGTVYSLRFQAITNADSSTSLQARVWQAGQAEPTTWIIKATDADTTLAGPGQLGIIGYLSSQSTVAPQTVRIHGYTAQTP